MGLDVAFNREKAIAAGLKLSRATNGTEEEIQAASQSDDPDYCEWLRSESELVHIPGTELVTDNNGVNDIVVRANTWGRVYGPLTTWLKANNIEWSEF